MSNNNSSIGLKYPLFATERGSQNVSRTTLEAVKADIITLLITRRGERVMNPTLGFSMDKYLFEPNVDSFIEDIKTYITESVNLWLPFLIIQEITITTTNEDKDKNQFKIKLVFSLNSTPTIFESVETLV